jgi:hypothetical protein
MRVIYASAGAVVRDEVCRLLVGIEVGRLVAR